MTCKCSARIALREPQRGGPDPMFVEGTDITVTHDPPDLHDRVERLETALSKMVKQSVSAPSESLRPTCCYCFEYDGYHDETEGGCVVLGAEAALKDSN